MLVCKVFGLTIIGSNEVAVVEKWWSTKGNLPSGKIIAMNGEAGIQPDVLRAGVYFKPIFMYKIYKYPLVTVPQGQMGYVFARDGVSLDSTQTLAKVVECSNFQDTRAFLLHQGQKGPQREILREGTYAINLAQFIVVTEAQSYVLSLGEKNAKIEAEQMRQNIRARNGFRPITIEDETDSMGIVTVHDGPSLPNGEIIAPVVGDDPSDENYHNNFQSPEKFLNAGGYRGKQYQVITDGTYYINRLFATVEIVQKTLIPIGYTGVVNSFIGEKGVDITGDTYTHGELVAEGYKGIWANPLQPGKYAFNVYAGEISYVPTTNIILKWENNCIGEHKFDSNLKEVTLITKDAFEPTLPLSVVIHIDYKKAPYVIQRFGDIQMLVEQSLDPMVSAYFKNTAQKLTLIELLQQRSEIQQDATRDMKVRFAEYSLDLVEVLIGTPCPDGDTKIEEILRQLSDRQLSKEQLVTYESKMEASKKEREYKEFQAKTEQQTELTKSSIDIEIQQNIGKAELQKAEQDALKTRKLADAKAYEQEKLAEAESKRQKHLADAKAYEKERLAESNASAQKQMAESEAFAIKATAEAEAESISKIGTAKAGAIVQQVEAYGGADYILKQEAINKITEALKEGKMPLVPQNVISMGNGIESNMNAMDSMHSLINLAVGEKLGIDFTNKK